MQDKPILFVDVDGVLSLWGFAPDRRPEGTFLSVDGIPHFLSAAAGRHLLELAAAFELVWCTGWEERANDHLPHLLGLPGPLPHLSLERGAGRTGHWKLGAVAAHAGERRPAAWIDDDLDESCRAWAARRPGPTLLVPTEPATGLGPAQAATLLGFARGIVKPRSSTTPSA